LELLDEAKIDILKIFGLNDALSSQEGEAIIKQRLRIFAEQKNFQSVGAMDMQDDYIQKQLTFGSLDQMIEKIMLLICSALRIPYSKVFGKGASGFSSGEDDLENYNGMVMSTIREPLMPLIKWMLDIRCVQLFGRTVDDLVVDWKPLRVLPETEEQNVKTQKINSLIQLCQLGVMTKKQVAEQLTTEKIILFKPEEIDAIDDTLTPDQMENIDMVDEVRNSKKPRWKFW
jgi:phage-related protein (TIGR01555 family)